VEGNKIYSANKSKERFVFVHYGPEGCRSRGECSSVLARKIFVDVLCSHLSCAALKLLCRNKMGICRRIYGMTILCSSTMPAPATSMNDNHRYVRSSSIVATRCRGWEKDHRDVAPLHPSISSSCDRCRQSRQLTSPSSPCSTQHDLQTFLLSQPA
jgi:hypothetical protein